jgi:transposase-like protein/ribosomal protein L37AE/L43A
MKEYPMTLTEFEDTFHTEAQCREYIARLRYANGIYLCHKCGNDKTWQVREMIYECSECGYQGSIIAGTIFQDTHKPLRLWFQAIWYITSQKNGTSALGLQLILGLGSYKTAWGWLHKLRKAMINPDRDRLSGTVEVDEAFFGGFRKGKRGRGSENKVLGAIAVEINDNKVGRIRLAIIDDASKESLHGFIKCVIETGSTIVTDGWASYNGLTSEGYKHIVQKCSEDSTLPHVHTVVSLIKRWILGTMQGSISREYLEYYFDEFTFRFNRRKSKSRGLLFYRLLQNAVRLAPVFCKEIQGNYSR